MISAKETSVDVELEIRKRIRERDKITFAEFMSLALFWPQGGYYSRPDRIGPAGDFYTAPTAHPAFGALLCLQMYQMWRLLDCPPSFWLVEMGAGAGVLCHDLAVYSSHLPRAFRDSLRYLCLDRLHLPGVERELPSEARAKVGRLAAESIPLRGITGCFISNELVDSFPVHRVAMKDGALMEIYLTLKDDQWVEMLGCPSTPALKRRLDSLGVSLPEGFTTEINLAIAQWIEGVSSALERGFLLTIDYGHPAKELYSDRRNRGTLTCFYRHLQTDNPYQRIGRQDMTAQVDFTSLVEVGRSYGLEPLGLDYQADFFQNLGLGRFKVRLGATGLKQREVEANRLGMLELTRPGGMGDFRVVAQGKGVGNPSLWGYAPDAEPEAMLEGLPVPLLTPHHMPLLEGRYPHLAFDWEGLLP